jgi:hypothetical protein
LAETELLLRICDRFGQLPSAVLEEDADLLRMLAIEDMARPREVDGG